MPASYVSHDLRQRHGDLVWRVRFHDQRCLYLVLHLEFQSTVNRAMAVRMLAYTTLLYQMIGEGVLREHDALPPVLPIVIYNGRRRWNAPADVSELIASGGAALARYQPSQRYFLLDEGRVGDAALPGARRLGEPLSRDRFPQPFQEPFELGHSFSELPELLGRLLSLGVDPVSKLSDLRVYPVAQPAVVTRRDPPHAEQYCCDHAHGGQHDRDDSSALHLSLGTLVVVGAGVNAGISSSRRPAAAGSGLAQLVIVLAYGCREAGALTASVPSP